MHVIERERLAEPSTLPLTRLVIAAADRGLKGVELLSDVTTTVVIQVATFAQEVEWVLQLEPEHTEVANDQMLSLGMAEDIVNLSQILLDVLDGYIELRAPRTERLRLCQAAEKFLAAGSHWVLRYTSSLDRTGHGRSGQTVAQDWHSLTSRIRASVRRCRHLTDQ